jgi:hypothetical protein
LLVWPGRLGSEGAGAWLTPDLELRAPSNSLSTTWPRRRSSRERVWGNASWVGRVTLGRPDSAAEGFGASPGAAASTRCVPPRLPDPPCLEAPSGTRVPPDGLGGVAAALGDSLGARTGAGWDPVAPGIPKPGPTGARRASGWLEGTGPVFGFTRPSGRKVGRALRPGVGSGAPPRWEPRSRIRKGTGSPGSMLESGIDLRAPRTLSMSLRP